MSILGSDLKIAVETYLDSAGLARENSKKILDYLDAEIESLEKAKAQSEREDLLAIDAPPADATGTTSTSGRMTRSERWGKTKEALDLKYSELAMQRDHLAK